MRYRLGLTIIMLYLSFLCSFRTMAQPDLSGHISSLSADTHTVNEILLRGDTLSLHQFDSAKALFISAWKLSEQLNYKSGVGNSLYKIGRVLFNHNQYDSSLFYWKQSVKYFDPDYDKIRLGNIYFGMGMSYDRKLNINLAVQSYLKSLNYFDSETGGRAKVNNAIGASFRSVSQNDQANTYYDKALILAQEEGDTSTWCGALLNKGIIYQHQDSINLSILFYDSAMNLSLRHALYKEFITASYNLIDVYLKMNNYKEAERVLFKAQKIAEYPGVYSRYKGVLYTQEGKLYRETAKYKMAEESFNKAAGLLEENIHEYLMALNELKILYAITNNYRKAYELQEYIWKVSSNLANQEVVTNAYELEIHYRTSEKDKQIAENKVHLLTAQQKINRKNLWIIVSTGVALLMILIYVTTMQRQKIKLQKSRAKEQESAIAQLNAALIGEENERARIGRQLHDDVMVEFSLAKMNLNAVSSEVPAVKNNHAYMIAAEQLNVAGKKIRQTAHNLMPDALLTEGLIDAINYFCNGIEARTDMKVKFQHYGDMPAVTSEMELNLYRIVQELIQNVVKHAKASEVLVQLYCRKDTISITVDDNGVGFKKKDKFSEGLGLKSIRSRIKVMNGEMEINTVQPQGTSVHIEVGIA